MVLDMSDGPGVFNGGWNLRWNSRLQSRRTTDKTSGSTSGKLSLTLMRFNLAVGIGMLGVKLLTICSLLFGASSFPDIMETSLDKKDTPFYENLCDEVIVRKAEAEVERVKP